MDKWLDDGDATMCRHCDSPNPWFEILWLLFLVVICVLWVAGVEYVDSRHRTTTKAVENRNAAVYAEHAVYEQNVAIDSAVEADLSAGNLSRADAYRTQSSGTKSSF